MSRLPWCGNRGTSARPLYGGPHLDPAGLRLELADSGVLPSAESLRCNQYALPEPPHRAIAVADAIVVVWWKR